MKVLAKNTKGAIRIRAAGERAFLVPVDSREKEYLKYAVHLLSHGLTRAVYSLEASYVFGKRNSDEITVSEKQFDNDGEAIFEIDTFFEGRAAEVFDESEVPHIRRGDKKVLLGVLFAAAVVLMCIFFKNSRPGNKIDAVNVTRQASLSLNDNEKEIARVMGTKEVTGRLKNIISSVQADPAARIAGMAVHRSEDRLAVSYVINTTKDYLYPEKDSVSSQKGLWEKSFSEKIVLGKKDIGMVNGAGFDVCALRMMENGFYVGERKESCADFMFEGDAARTVDRYNSILGCYVFLSSLNIASGRGKLDVTLCKQ